MRHDPKECDNTDGFERSLKKQRGYATLLEYVCPECGRKGTFLRNWIGERTLMCNGIRFLRVRRRR